MINTIVNMKLILFNQKFLIGFIWFPFKIKISSLFNFLIFLHIFYSEYCHSTIYRNLSDRSALLTLLNRYNQNSFIIIINYW